MTRNLLPNLAFATVAAVGLYVSTLGLPLPDSCVGTVGVADAAPTPSRSCGGDLRECLRQSADLRQTTFGGRYVTAEDVAMCVDAFNACAHGAAGRGGNQGPPTSTSAASSNQRLLPGHFEMRYRQRVHSDCRISGDAIGCTTRLDPLPEGVASWEAKVIGTVAGLTATGTKTEHVESLGDCPTASEGTGPFTYTFAANGTFTITEGPFQWETTSCRGSNSHSEPARSSVGAWSELN